MRPSASRCARWCDWGVCPRVNLTLAWHAPPAQCAWRVFAAKKRVAQRRKVVYARRLEAAAMMVQTHWRCLRAKRALGSMREAYRALLRHRNGMALRIQRLWRGHNARAYVKALRIEIANRKRVEAASALAIQCHFRRWQARRELASRRRALEREEQLRLWACRRIQAAYRGRLGRKTMAQIVEAARVRCWATPHSARGHGRVSPTPSSVPPPPAAARPCGLHHPVRVARSAGSAPLHGRATADDAGADGEGGDAVAAGVVEAPGAADVCGRVRGHGGRDEAKERDGRRHTARVPRCAGSARGGAAAAAEPCGAGRAVVSGASCDPVVNVPSPSLRRPCRTTRTWRRATRRPTLPARSFSGCGAACWAGGAPPRERRPWPPSGASLRTSPLGW